MTYSKENKSIEYHVLYKKRKSFGIYIDVYGNIELRVPKDAKEEQILRLLEDKWNWIITKQEEMVEKSKGFKEKVYEGGETFLYLGRSYPIQIIIDETLTKDHVIFQEDTLHVNLKSHEEERIKQALQRFYYQECKRIAEERIRIYQAPLKMKPRKVSISDNKATWGTCDSKHQLTFNWKLVMAPLDVIDYVVVHELCHMVHLNHDRSFWRLVGRFIPDYEEKQAWLAQSSWKMVV
ncbi:MAG: M48 family metallopeptidase [Vallitaleaceae bacterium]|nr:M48 family metallopeptidase [Vallitaleaceae bacterium]